MEDHTVPIEFKMLPIKMQQRLNDVGFMGAYITLSIHDVITQGLRSKLTIEETRNVINLWTEEFRLNSVVEGVDTYLKYITHVG